MQQRLRSKPHSLEDRIAAEKARCTDQVADTPRGPEKDALVKKLRQLDTASHMNDYAVAGAQVARINRYVGNPT